MAMMFFQRTIIGAAASLVLAILLGAVAAIGAARAEGDALTIYLFWQKGCPYCAGARTELAALAEADPRIELQVIEIGTNADADALFEKALVFFDHDQAAVPLIVIGDRSFLGFFAGGRSAILYRQAAERCLNAACPDVIAGLSGGLASSEMVAPSGIGAPADDKTLSLLPEVVSLPVIGEVHPRNLSLPALTMLLAAIDGFNPCAMWVLVFLIGLLLGLKDEKRMWLLGGAFLGATAVMYFAVMAAWLNLILFLHAVIWVRIAIGALAVGGGIYFLREYWTKPEAACRVTNPNWRQKIMNTFRSVVNDNRLILSVGGIMALAVMVNFIELLCSAGIPAVYTQMLALNDLPLATYYLYLSLYIAVFMLDDIAIFATAMFALRVTGLTGSYSRFSHLIGGVVLLAIGAIMLLRPELLSFY
jgi:glutaredoxin